MKSYTRQEVESLLGRRSNDELAGIAADFRRQISVIAKQAFGGNDPVPALAFNRELARAMAGFALMARGYQSSDATDAIAAGVLLEGLATEIVEAAAKGAKLRGASLGGDAE